MRKHLCIVLLIMIVVACNTNSSYEPEGERTQAIEMEPPRTAAPPPPPPVIFEEYEGNYGISASSNSPNVDGISLGYCALDTILSFENFEAYEAVLENEFVKTLEEPLSTFSIDVDGAAYSNVRRFLNDGQLPPPNAVRIEEFVNYFNYNYKNPEGVQPFSIHTEVATCPWNPKSQLVHVGLQGQRLMDEDLPDNNLVFLLDVSGSMMGAHKLPLIQSAFRLLVEELDHHDRIAIVVYAGAAGLILPSTPGHQKDKILSAIGSLEAGGSTAGGEGIQLAYEIAQKHFKRKGNNRIILATDGDFNVGVSDDDALVELIEEKRKSGVFLSVLGFGSGNYKDVKMEKLADHGNGNYNYIDHLREAKKVLISEMGGTLHTIAKDVKIQIEFNPTKVAEYRLIGYENRMLLNKDFEDDTKDAGELGAGHSVTALYEVIPVENAEVSASPEYRYQETSVREAAFVSSEIAHVKFRYKAPNGTESRLINQPILFKNQGFNQSSEDFQFAAAVVEFGLILRTSNFKGKANLEHVIRTAEKAKGKDLNGYRAEFIQLVKQAQTLMTLNG
ncbi:MAG: VWA domain-containing protein [Bacteroidota bacterium]